MTPSSWPGRSWRAVTGYGAVIRRFHPNARRYLLYLLLCAVALGIFGLLFNLYLLELGFDEAFVGQMVGATSLGTMLGGIPAGLLYTRRGGRVVFVGNALIVSLTWVILMAVRQPVWLLAASFVNGAAGSLLYTASYPFMADETNERERPYIFSLNGVFWTLSDMVGRPLGGFLPGLLQTGLALPSLAAAYRASIFVAVGITLLALVPALAIRQRPVTAATASPSAVQTAHAADGWRANLRGFVGGGASILCIGVSIGLSTSFYNVYFSQFHRASTEQVGLIFFLSSFIGLFTLFAIPGVAQRFGLVRGIALSSLICAPFLWMLGLPLPLSVATGSYLLASLLNRFAVFMLFNLIMEVVSPAQRGRMASLRVVVNYLTYSVTGVVGGWLIVQRGYGWLFAGAALASLLTGVVTWGFFGRRRPA